MQIPQDLIETAALKLKSIQSEAEFFQLRAKFLGKKSFVASSFSKLRGLKSDEKVIAAKELNILKNNLIKLFETALADFEGKNMGKKSTCGYRLKIFQKMRGGKILKDGRGILKISRLRRANAPKF